MRNFSVFLIILIQTGYCLYVESSGTTPGDRAELVSLWLSGRPDFMYGKTMGSLALTGPQINVIPRKELVQFLQERRSRPILNNRNREHRSSDGFKVQGKYIPEILRPGSDAELFISRT